MRKILGYIISIFTIILFLGFTDFKSLIGNIDTQVGKISQKEIILEEDQVFISRVIDGDTVIVRMPDGSEERVRLLLIDTPESVHPTEPVQKFGPEASAFAKETLKTGDKVTLEKGNPERDRYDRLLGYIWVGDTNFNQLMIEKAYARVAYVYEPNTKYIEEFREAEQKAKDKKLNIWSIPGYVTEKGFDMSVVQ